MLSKKTLIPKSLFAKLKGVIIVAESANIIDVFSFEKGFISFMPPKQFWYEASVFKKTYFHFLKFIPDLKIILRFS